MNQTSILIIDDETSIRRFLRIVLESQSYRVIEAETGQEGINTAAMKHPDLILLDLMLPDVDGFTVLKRIREWSDVPVIVLSVREAEEDKVAALDASADDYLTKPFGTEELLARIRSCLRHARKEMPAVFTSGDLSVDITARLVRVDGREVKMSDTEYRLLLLMIKNAGRVLTHNQILKEVWGPEHADDVQYLRVYVAQLRKKIEKDPANPDFIINEPGVGYRFKGPGSEMTGGGKTENDA